MSRRAPTPVPQLGLLLSLLLGLLLGLLASCSLLPDDEQEEAGVVASDASWRSELQGPRTSTLASGPAATPCFTTNAEGSGGASGAPIRRDVGLVRVAGPRRGRRGPTPDDGDGS